MLLLLLLCWWLPTRVCDEAPPGDWDWRMRSWAETEDMNERRSEFLRSESDLRRVAAADPDPDPVPVEEEEDKVVEEGSG